MMISHPVLISSGIYEMMVIYAYSPFTIVKFIIKIK